MLKAIVENKGLFQGATIDVLRMEQSNSSDVSIIGSGGDLSLKSEGCIFLYLNVDFEGYEASIKFLKSLESINDYAYLTIDGNRVIGSIEYIDDLSGLVKLKEKS